MAWPERIRAAQLAGVPSFGRLWLGQGVAQVGAQMSLVAIPILAVVGLHADALQMGLLGTAATLPVLLVALPVGVLVDRGDPRALLIAADLGRATLAALVPAFALSGRLTLAVLMAVAAGAGALTAMFDISYQSFVPRLVPRDRLEAGNARLEVSRAASTVFGPGLGGAVIQAIMAPAAVGLGALTFACSVAALLGLRVPGRERQALARSGRGRIGDMGQGLSRLFGRPLLRAIAGCAATANFFGTMAGAVYVLFALRLVGRDPLLLGLVYAAQSTGGVLGASFAPAVARRLGTAAAIRWLAVAFCLAPLAVPLAPRDAAMAVPVLAAAGATQALARSAYTVLQISLRQRETPPTLLGRVNAGMRLATWIGLPFGYLAGGLVGEWLGVVDALWLAAAGGCLALTWLVGRAWTRREPPMSGRVFA